MDVPSTLISDEDALSDELRKMALVREMKETMERLIGDTGLLQAQSEAFNGLDQPKSIVINAEPSTLHKLRDILNAHNAEHGANLEQVKHELREEFKKQFEERVKDKLRETMRASMASEIKVQVEEQLKEHMQVGLRQQAEEVKLQLREVKFALQNSEARMANAQLDSTDLYKPLAVVVTSAGKKSANFPLDMCSLFAYSVDAARALVRDYGLVEAEELEVNIKMFLEYIGVQIDFTK